MAAYIYVKKRTCLSWACENCRYIYCFINTAFFALYYCRSSDLSFILFGGLGDLYNPIQNISEFGQCTLVINKAEYLIADFLLTYLSVVVATSIIYMLMNVFRNRKNVFRNLCVFTCAFICAFIFHQPLFLSNSSANSKDRTDYTPISYQRQDFSSFFLASYHIFM